MKSLLDEFQILMGLDVNYMPEEYKEDIFHYTSSNGFNSILFNEDEKIILWASRFDCQNDFTEGKLALTVFKEVCDKMLEQGELSKNLYDVIYDVRATRTHLFIRYNKDGDPIFSRPECDRYITCFSKNSDSLAMWNYYSKGSKYDGFNIGLSPTQIKLNANIFFKDKEVDIKIHQIIYKKDKQKAMIRKLILRLEELYEEKWNNQIRYIISNQLYDWSLVFKSEFFQHEEEVRVIVYVAKRTKIGVLQPSPIDIHYRDNFGLTIPYILLKVEKDLLHKITIGPLYCEKEQKEMQKKIMIERLFYNGYKDVKVDYSNIPVRY